MSNVAPPMASRVLTTTTDRLRPRGDGLGQGPEQVRVGAVAARHGRRAHHDEVGLLGLAQDRVADVGRLAQDGLALALEVLLDERGERPFRLGADGHRDARRHEVEDDDRRAVVRRDRVGEADRELGVRAAADRHEDALDVARAALLDDRDVARRLADDLVDRRREDGRAAVAAVVADRRLAAPAEDDEVGLLLGGGLDDALGGVPADAHDRVDRRPVRARSRAPSGAAAGRAGRASRPRTAACPRAPRRCPSADSSPARGSSIAAPSRISSSAVPGFATGMRIRAGQRRPGAHPRLPSPAAFQRSTRYGLSSSNSRAWRSTRSSACSVVMCRFSMTNEPTRPK